MSNLDFYTLKLREDAVYVIISALLETFPRCGATIAEDIFKQAGTQRQAKTDEIQAIVASLKKETDGESE